MVILILKGATLSGDNLINITGVTVTYNYNTGYSEDCVAVTMDVTLRINNNSFTGVKKEDNQMKRFKSGTVDAAYTGLAKNTDGKWYYVNKGTHVPDYTGVCYSTDGKLYYAKDGKWDTTFTGKAKDAEGKEYNVTNGRVV